MTQIERGHTKLVTATVAASGSNVDPDSSALYVTITNLQTGEEYLSRTAMTRSDTGTYTYYLTTSTTDELGDYEVIYDGLYNTRAILQNEIIQFVDRE